MMDNIIKYIDISILTVDGTSQQDLDFVNGVIME